MYGSRINFGDELTPLVIDVVLGKEYRMADKHSADAISIGFIVDWDYGSNPIHVLGSGSNNEDFKMKSKEAKLLGRLPVVRKA